MYLAYWFESWLQVWHRSVPAFKPWASWWRWRGVLITWTTVCKCLWSTQPVTLRGRRMSSRVAVEFKPHGAVRETAISYSFAMRYINKLASTSSASLQQVFISPFTHIHTIYRDCWDERWARRAAGTDGGREGGSTIGYNRWNLIDVVGRQAALIICNETEAGGNAMPWSSWSIGDRWKLDTRCDGSESRLIWSPPHSQPACQRSIYWLAAYIAVLFVGEQTGLLKNETLDE
jgi:hypothetical protein